MQIRLEKTAPNIVGYQAFPIPEDGYNTTAGAAFKAINEKGTWTCDNNVLGTTVAEGDYVYIFNEALWDVDSYMFNGFDGETSLGWTLYRLNEDGEQYGIPLQSFEVAKGDELTFEPGDGVSGITVAGEVENTTKTATWEIAPDEYQASIMNPFPIDTMLSEISSFAVEGDYLYIFNPELWDVDSYMFNGEGNGWTLYRLNEDGEQFGTEITDEEAKSYLILPAGRRGVYEQADENGRKWNVAL